MNNLHQCKCRMRNGKRCIITAQPGQDRCAIHEDIDAVADLDLPDVNPGWLELRRKKVFHEAALYNAETRQRNRAEEEAELRHLARVDPVGGAQVRNMADAVGPRDELRGIRNLLREFVGDGRQNAANATIGGAGASAAP